MVKENIRTREDWELTELIRKEKDEEALKELCNRHSGIFISAVQKYGSPMSKTQKLDLLEDKELYIYDAACKYDKDRAKFSTFLNLQVSYLCKTQNTINRENNKFVDSDEILLIESKEERPDMILSKKEVLDNIWSLINKHPDKRAKIIFKERYLTTKDFKLKTWQEIGKKMNLTAQACIDLHNKVIKYLNKEIKKNEVKF